MTPDRRLDQLEPLMADSLQKIDRLIEGQGQILEIATRADQKADITANGLANLTTYVQQGFSNVQQGFSNVQQGFSDVQQEFTDVQQGFTDVQQGFSDVQQGFSDVRKDISDLKAGQEAIMQYLREKLS